MFGYDDEDSKPAAKPSASSNTKDTRDAEEKLEYSPNDEPMVDGGNLDVVGTKSAPKGQGKRDSWVRWTGDSGSIRPTSTPARDDNFASTTDDVDNNDGQHTEQASRPLPPVSNIRPGAYHDDGRNARDVEADLSTVHEQGDNVQVDSIVQQPEVSAELVDTVQQRIDRKVKQTLDNAEVAQVVTGFWCTKRAKILSGTIVLLAIVAIVTMAVVLPQRVGPAESAPTMPPTSPLPGLVELLSSSSLDGGVALQTPSSPQNKALYWLAGNSNLGTYSDEKKLQRHGLATLYYSTDGDSWESNSRWLSNVDECGWEGSACQIVVEDEMELPVCPELVVTSLMLSSNQLDGTIPEEIGTLTYMERLDLSDNKLRLTGTIPQSIGNLSHLEFLALNGNSLTGTIPSTISLLSNLKTLILARNDLAGADDFVCPDVISLCYITCDNRNVGNVSDSDNFYVQLLELQCQHENAADIIGHLPS